MKWKRLEALVIAAFCGCVAGSASAATIGFSPPSQTVSTGASVAVELVISDLGGEIVSAYDLDVTYDAAILSAVSVTFGPKLGDVSLFEVINASSVAVAGVVDLAQISLLSDPALLALQGGDSFVLATLEFIAQDTGVSPLDFVFGGTNEIVGLGARPLETASQSGSATVVPEPGAALLFLVGAAVIGRAVHPKRRA